MNYSLLNASNLDTDNNFYSSYSSQDTSGAGTDNLISKKKNNNNRTQKKVSIGDNDDVYFTPKVNKLMNALNNTGGDDDDDEKLHNFTPISPPMSSGVQNTILRDNSNASKTKYNADSPSIADDPTQYFKKIIPPTENVINQYPLFNDTNYFSSNSQSQNQPQHNSSPYMPNYGSNNMSGSGGGGDDVMMRKLNYLIHLLEEKRDERTNNVMEEVILYSFIGIFVIFIVDSFTKVGRYKR